MTHKLQTKLKKHIKTILFQIIAGVILGRFIIQPFVTTIFWLQFRHRTALTYWEMLYNQYRVTNGLLTAAEIMLAYSVLGILIVWLFSKIASTSNDKKQLLTLFQKELDSNINKLITDGESDLIEFKSSLRWDIKKQTINKSLDKAVIKTIAAFLNSKGGTLVIGVDDQGEVLGLDKDMMALPKKNTDGFELLLLDLLSTRLGADLAAFVKIIFHNINDKEICRVIVSPAPRPVYVKDNADAKFYVRLGASTRELNVADAVNYISSSGNF